MPVRARVVAVFLGCAMVLPLSMGAAASTVPNVVPAPTARVVGSDGGGTGDAAVPVLQWDECSDDFGLGGEDPEGTTFSCAWATVPLDYDDPTGATIQIALKRLQAGQPESKLGTLFINPGGPGGSGVDFATVAWAYFPQTVLDRFDVVGFDPRGVARSAPLVCFESFQQLTRTFGVVPPFPIDRHEYRMIDRAIGQYTALCDENGSEVIDHMSTADVARDLDLLRRAVGDDGLSYVGYSYGSQIGSVYANLFPNSVRALVVDGVLDPIAWTTGRGRADRQLPLFSRQGSDVGASQTLEQFFALCQQAGPEVCSLAAQGDPKAIYDATAAALREGPVRADVGGAIFEMTYQDLVGLSVSFLSGPFGWTELAWIVSQVAAAAGIAPPVDLPVGPPPEVPLVPAAIPFGRAGVPATRGAPMPQTLEGFEGVACSDSDNPRNLEAWWGAGRARDRQAPYFGSLWAWSSAGCADWPGRAADRYTGPWTAQTSNPVLVVGNTYDPATPYSGAQTVADLLPGARLLTVTGWGHTSIGLSSCATAAVADYLVDGVLPAEGATCAMDVTPFFDAVEPGLQRTDGAPEAALREAREIVTGQLPGRVSR